MASQSNDELEVVAEAGVQLAFSGPALLSNKVYVTRTPLGLRLSFMETTPDGKSDHFRAAVFLQYPDVQSLKDLLAKAMDDVKIEVVKPDKRDKQD